MRRVVERSFLVAALIVLVVGCGDDGPKLITASGVVKYNGNPLPNATVTFTPPDTAKGIPVASGTTNDNGEFTLSSGGKTGAAAGTFNVTVVAVEGKSVAAEDVSKSTDPNDILKKMGTSMAPKGEGEQREKTMGLEAKSLIPTKYNTVKESGLSFTVKAGDKNHFEIPLAD